MTAREIKYLDLVCLFDTLRCDTCISNDNPRTGKCQVAVLRNHARMQWVLHTLDA